MLQGANTASTKARGGTRTDCPRNAWEMCVSGGTDPGGDGQAEKSERPGRVKRAGALEVQHENFGSWFEGDGETMKLNNIYNALAIWQ